MFIEYENFIFCGICQLIPSETVAEHSQEGLATINQLACPIYSFYVQLMMEFDKKKYYIIMMMTDIPI